MGAAVGRVRQSTKERNKPSDDQTEREGGMREERGEDRLWSSFSEHGRRGTHALRVAVCRIHWTGTKVGVHERIHNRIRKGARVGLSTVGEGSRDKGCAHLVLTCHSPSSRG